MSAFSPAKIWSNASWCSIQPASWLLLKPTPETIDTIYTSQNHRYYTSQNCSVRYNIYCECMVLEGASLQSGHNDTSITQLLLPCASPPWKKKTGHLTNQDSIFLVTYTHSVQVELYRSYPLFSTLGQAPSFPPFSSLDLGPDSIPFVAAYGTRICPGLWTTHSAQTQALLRKYWYVWNGKLLPLLQRVLRGSSLHFCFHRFLANITPHVVNVQPRPYDLVQAHAQNPAWFYCMRLNTAQNDIILEQTYMG